MLPSYRMVHNQLSRERGRAREHNCSCGRRAETWAYQYTAEIELRDRAGAVYSAELSDYVAMCMICHVRLDRTVSHPQRENEVWVEPRPYHTQEPLAELRERDPEAYRALRRKAGQATAKLRRTCAECPMTASPGNMARHQRASGHTGWS